VRPLDGIIVVALEHAVAAPFCTRQLADLGARVIKIERPGSGDFARAYDERVRGLASFFVWLNRSKESLTLDVKQPEAHAFVPRMDSVPALGQHTDSILAELGWSGPDIQRLRAAGSI
jgi:itaconate CoA-transferase